MMWIWFFPVLMAAFMLLRWARHDEDGWGCCGMRHMPIETRDANQPLEIARRRFARGEISVDEYEEIRRRLG